MLSARVHARVLVRLAAALVCAVAGTTGAAPALVAPAMAHGEDPLLRVRLTEVTGVAGGLPSKVTVQVHTTVSEQMVVANPTQTPLSMLDPSGRPFVTVSDEGVLADLHSEFFFETLGPPDAPADVPESAQESTRPRWRLVSRESSWGWFDPRLHPGASTHPDASPATAEPEPGDPGDEHEVHVLERWAVPMRYGSEKVTARGELVREPLLGTWAPGAVEAPAGVTVNMLPGPRPALAMTRTTARSVSVLDDQGTPILRLDSAGVAVDPLSDAALSTSGATSTAGALSTSGSVHGAAGHELVVTGPGSFHAWLDERVQPAHRAPVDPSRVTAEGWSIPVVVDGREQAIRGEWRWQPAAAGVASTASPPDRYPGLTWALPAGVAASALLAVGLRLLGRRRPESASTGSQSNGHSPASASAVRRGTGA